MRHERKSSQASIVLEKQARLIDAHEALAWADFKHRKWQILGERVGAALKVLTVLVGLLLLGAAGGFVWSAANADGMVVEPFAVPPAIERRGLNGSVVAAQLLDRLIALEAATQSARAPSSYANSWGEDSDVEVPYTGVSLGQLRQELKDWLGSEKRLAGELVDLGGNRIAVTFRTGGSSGTVVGSSADPDELLQRASMAIFRSTQPYRYSVWLSRNEPGSPESRKVLEELSRSSDLKERLWGLHGLALFAESDEEYVAVYRRALRLKPDFLPAIGNLPFPAIRAGQEEKAYKLSVRAEEAYRRGQEDYNPGHAAGYAKEAAARNAQFKGNLLEAARLRTSALDDAAGASNTALRPFAAAAAWAALHDFAGAKIVLEGVGYTNPARRAEVESLYGRQDTIELLMARSVGDHRAEATELHAELSHKLAVVDNPASPVVQRREALSELPWIRSELAVALARSKLPAEAKAIIADAPSNHDAAIRARAFIAAVAGQQRESEVLFTRAVARTPSLPAAHALWAEARLQAGDTQGAIEHARSANQKGPNWAEPLKIWGHALARQKSDAEAISKFEAAVKRAPRWGALRIALGKALWREGRFRQARQVFLAAAQMDLNREDKRHLERIFSIVSERWPTR